MVIGSNYEGKTGKTEKKELVNTHVFGNPSGGVEPSYKQRFPRSQRFMYMVVKCSAISCIQNFMSIQEPRS